ncbi:antibiotic biosynthesis monooxygenase [Cohnella zeiphila]|uniref:Antibiotic biosynthesis monooxygenase n=1 Tax=Cohnella zeiphila TaxID=2761120 RepID=A0A7X0SJU8_9BACL|nr:antibiotic biosynthesis monooxygenase [Cohnella zeiphila]MBB6731312.1 antibiotic biosynthesis monooxygenase [Cohnella zeiphila]
MIVATNTIRIKSGFADQVAERFKSPKGVQHAPGFVRMELLQTSQEDHDELKVCTTWESREAFEGWVNSDAFKQAHAHARPAGGSAPGAADGAAHSHAQAASAEGSHAHASSEGGTSAQQPPGGGIMLGSTLSVHEVVFSTGRND